MPVIDIHTHMLTLEWIELLRLHGGKYSVKKTPGKQDAVHLYDAPFMTLMPGMWDYGMRIKNMDKAGVDIAIISLTCPNVFWGDRETVFAVPVWSMTPWRSNSAPILIESAGLHRCLGNMPLRLGRSSRAVSKLVPSV